MFYPTNETEGSLTTHARKFKIVSHNNGESLTCINTVSESFEVARNSVTK